MTEGQQIYRRNLLRRIHIHPWYKSAKQSDGWEAFLMENYGVASSGRLSIDELRNLLGVMDGRMEPEISGEREGMATRAQIATIEKLWLERARESSQPALMHYVRRVVGVMPLSLSILSKIQASAVIIAIKKL